MTQAIGLDSIKDGPRRVLIDSNGEAVSPKRAKELGIEPSTIFIRDDGWSLGCIKNHEPIAAQMWNKNWFIVVRNYGNPSQEIIPYSEFTPTRGNGQPVD